MSGSRQRQQGGQSLIFVGIAIALLFGLLAAALDTGNLYQVRREMQNAADAGALAGAHELCFGTGNPVNAKNKADQYAMDNGAVFPFSKSSVNTTSGVVSVTARITATTWLASMIGVSQSPVGATAQAACGVATSACGLWPLTLKDTEWNKFSTQCGRDFALFDDQPNQQPVDCTVYNCNVFPLSSYPNNPPMPSTEWDILQNQSRQWVDFTAALAPYQDQAPCDQGSGCGTNEINCWLANNSGAPIEIGDCLGGLNGSRGGTVSDVNARKGDFVLFPIYGSLCPGTAPGSCTGLYRVSAFGCVEVVGYVNKGSGNSTSFQLHAINPNTTPPQVSVRLIHVKVGCNQCNTSCGGTSGGGPPGPGQVGAVSLIQ